MIRRRWETFQNLKCSGESIMKTSQSIAFIAFGLAAGARLGAASDLASLARNPVQVCVLGVYHMANPGRDVVNSQSDDVLAPARQNELEALASQLAAFRPTKIAVENQAAPPTFFVSSYESFDDELLRSVPGEPVQIGFRLAKKLGHAHVYGFDEWPGPDEPDYFPYEKVQNYAKEHHQNDVLDASTEILRAHSEAFAQMQKRASISELLAHLNDPAYDTSEYRESYNQLLVLGDGDRQPGAELVSFWFMRNAKMFSKVINFAEPGDRILLIVGAGHRYWLRHLAANTPGFEYVEVKPYLSKPSSSQSSK
jgi:Family of unknown function (DUF5694)